MIDIIIGKKNKYKGKCKIKLDQTYIEEYFVEAKNENEAKQIFNEYFVEKYGICPDKIQVITIENNEKIILK